MNILKQDPPVGAGHIAIYGQDDTLLLFVPLSIDTVDTAARCAGRAWRSLWGRLAPLRQEAGPFAVVVEVDEAVTLAHFGLTHTDLAALVSRKLLQADAVAALPTERRQAVEQRGVVAVEFALLLAAILLPTIAGCSAVDTAIRGRWPGVSLLEVVADAVAFHADRVAAKKNPPPAPI